MFQLLNWFPACWLKCTCWKWNETLRDGAHHSLNGVFRPYALCVHVGLFRIFEWVPLAAVETNKQRDWKLPTPSMLDKFSQGILPIGRQKNYKHITKNKPFSILALPVPWLASIMTRNRPLCGKQRLTDLQTEKLSWFIIFDFLRFGAARFQWIVVSVTNCQCLLLLFWSGGVGE